MAKVEDFTDQDWDVVRILIDSYAGITAKQTEILKLTKQRDDLLAQQTAAINAQKDANAAANTAIYQSDVFGNSLITALSDQIKTLETEVKDSAAAVVALPGGAVVNP